MPGLSTMLAYDPTNFNTASTHFQRLAEMWEHTYSANDREAHALDFEGVAAGALRDATGHTRMAAVRNAAVLYDAAETTARGADSLRATHKAFTDVHSQATQDGYQVNEDLSVTDPKARNAIERAARQIQGEIYATDLQRHATALYAENARIGTAVTGHAGALGIQAVDYTTPTNPVDQLQGALTAPPSSKPSTAMPMPSSPPATVSKTDSSACQAATGKIEDDRERKLLERGMAGAAVGGIAGGVLGDGVGALPGAAEGFAAGIFYGALDQATNPHPLPPECK